MSTLLPLNKIRIDGGTQARVEIDLSTVERYVEAMRDGDELPPITVYFDGVEYWLADGFHRYHAHRSAELDDIAAEVKEGTRRDAILYAVGTNAEHGKPRTNKDKRRAIALLLNDETWATWSNREIGRRCKVRHETVASVRGELGLLTGDFASERTYTTKHGTVATMTVGNIGKSLTLKVEQPPAEPSPAPPPDASGQGQQVVAKAPADEASGEESDADSNLEQEAALSASTASHDSYDTDADSDDDDEDSDELLDGLDGEGSVEQFEIWNDEELALLEQRRQGQTVVLNMSAHRHFMQWAIANGAFVRIDRKTIWGNPFELG